MEGLKPLFVFLGSNCTGRLCAGVLGHIIDTHKIGA
jgi:hypothetical protein